MAKDDPSTPRRASAGGLTRQQVARQLGVGITTVLRMCQRGELHPKQAANGVWRYDPAEVVRLCAQRTTPGRRTLGQTTAAAYQMFDTGAELKDIVLALQISADEVRRHYRDWQSSLDDPPPVPLGPAMALLDEDPGADEVFSREMTEAHARFAGHPPTNKKGRRP
jgi:transposase-like protein